MVVETEAVVEVATAAGFDELPHPLSSRTAAIPSIKVVFKLMTRVLRASESAEPCLDANGIFRAGEILGI